MTRPVTIILAVSLFLALLGGIMFGQGGHYLYASHAHRSLEAMAQSLPEPQRERFTDRMRAGMKEARPLFKEMRKARRQAEALLLAEPFDRKAWLEQAGQVQQLRSQIKTRIAQGIADIAEQSTLEERRALAEALQQHRRMHREP